MDGEKSPFLDGDEAGEGSSDTDDEVLYSKHLKAYPKGKRNLISFLLIGVLAISLVGALLIGIFIGHYTLPKLAPSLSSNATPPTQPPNTAAAQPATSCTNTHSLVDDICSNPPILLISLDGFWSGYLKRNFTPFIHSLAASGVKADYMRSEFPTKTYPNHFSIATGLHPESHGIVNNYFYDVDLQEQFKMMDEDSKTKSQWWLAEPVWVTAAKEGLKTAVFGWPAAEVDFHGIRPTIYYPYDESSFEERVQTVLSWFKLPSKLRPQLMAVYFEQPDETGHEGGPNSQKVNDMLRYVDKTVASLFDGLREMGVMECVNSIIVSDHGMAPFDTGSFIQLMELLPKELIPVLTHFDYGVVGGVHVPMNENHDRMVEQIYNSLIQNGTKAGMPFRAYLREDLPLRLHAGHFNKQRYGDIYLITDEGSTIKIQEDPKNRTILGNHGYDNILKDVQAIFIGHGPAFRKGYVSEAFANIELYNLLCGLLGISPSPNNGTVGSLYHMLTPSLLPTLPPPQTFQGSEGVSDSCPYPTDEDTYNMRSFCDECVCWSNDKCADVSNATMDDSNLLLNLNTDEMTGYQAVHLPWGVPNGGEGSSSCLLTQQDYVTLYSNTLHIPLWSAFKLTKKQASISRSSGGCLRRDPRVPPPNSSNCTHYATEGGEEFVAVRLAAALSTSSTAQQLTTNLLSNVVPQMTKFNTRVWLPLENMLRSWAVNFSTIHIILGSVLDVNRDGERDNDTDYTRRVGGIKGVAIPTHFYAVVVRCINDEGMEPADCEANQLDALGLLFQHPTADGDPSPTSKLLRYALTPIRDIERVTGVSFFPALKVEDKNTLEMRLTNELWRTNLSL